MRMIDRVMFDEFSYLAGKLFMKDACDAYGNTTRYLDFCRVLFLFPKRLLGNIIKGMVEDRECHHQMVDRKETSLWSDFVKQLTEGLSSSDG